MSSTQPAADQKPRDSWYKLPVWRHPTDGRRAQQLAAEPFCRYCARNGKQRKATVADHITPHRGNWTAFLKGPLQSLCWPCHSGPKQREERNPPRPKIGPDGWPIEPGPKGG